MLCKSDQFNNLKTKIQFDHPARHYPSTEGRIWTADFGKVSVPNIGEILEA